MQISRPASGLPEIAVLATGGTIASTAGHGAALTRYEVTEGVETLLAAAPELASVARLTGHQVFNTDSRYVTGSHLLRLAAASQAALDEPGIAGIVITHGTDTMEETAWFLNLVLKTAKPVVLTGAMRPASALSADGPMNLFNAVALAASPAARGQGVLVAMNGVVWAAREASKRHTSALDAFGAGEAGCLGTVLGATVTLWHAAPRHHTLDTQFSMHLLSAPGTLPRVDILYDHQDARDHLYKASIESGVHGIVVAGMGNGSLSAGAQAGVKAANAAGLACVRSSRTGDGPVTADDDEELGTISAGRLNPQKARILLMLALTQSREREDIRACFERY